MLFMVALARTGTIVARFTHLPHYFMRGGGVRLS